MADNKKPKQDYREALAAQAEKVAPKDKRKETLTYDVGGEIVTIVRGDMSDESWEKVKAQVAPKEQTLKSKSLDWTTLMSLGQNLDGVSDSVVSKEDKKLVARMPEWDRAEFLRQRFRTKGYDVPPNSADDEKASLKKQPEAEVAKPAAKPSGPTPDEWTPYPTEPTKPKSQGTQTEDDQMVGSADPGMSPRGQMMRMAMGATPAQERLAEQEANVARVKAQGEKHGQEDLAALKGMADKAASAAAAGKQAQDAVSPGNVIKTQIDERIFGDKPLVPEGVGNVISQMPQAAGAFNSRYLGSAGMLAGEALGMPNLERAGAGLVEGSVMPPAFGGPVSQSATMPPGPVTPAAPAGQPQPTTPPQEDPQMAAMRLAMQAPGGFREVGVDPAAKKALRDAIKEQHNNSLTQKETIQQNADNIAWQQWETTKATRQKMADGERLAAEAAQAQLTHIQQAEQFNNARQTVLEEARRAASNPIDPNRFWNNKSDGQKAMGVIAGALFGFTGQGMQWLNRLDALVSEDNRLQEGDRASRVSGLRAEAEGLGQAAKFAMEKGATLSQAKLIERDAKYQTARTYLEQMQATTQNAQVQMRAQEMLGHLDAQMVRSAEQGVLLSTQEAGMINSARAQKANLERERLEFMAKTAGEGTGGRPLPEAGTKLMDEYSAAVQTLREMQDKVKNSGVGGRLWQKFAQAGWTPGNAEEKALYNDYRGLKYKWMTLKARGALQGIEIAALEDMLPERGQLLADPSVQIAPMIQTAERDFDRAIDQQEKSGFDMRRWRQQRAPAAPRRTERPAEPLK